MSLSRKIRRDAMKRNGTKSEVNRMPVQGIDGGGYREIHPTKGWKTISGKRLIAQGKIAAIRELIDVRKGIRVSANQALLNSVMASFANNNAIEQAAQAA